MQLLYRINHVVYYNILITILLYSYDTLRRHSRMLMRWLLLWSAIFSLIASMSSSSDERSNSGQAESPLTASPNANPLPCSSPARANSSASSNATSVSSDSTSDEPQTASDGEIEPRTKRYKFNEPEVPYDEVYWQPSSSLAQDSSMQDDQPPPSDQNHALESRFHLVWHDVSSDSDTSLATTVCVSDDSISDNDDNLSISSSSSVLLSDSDSEISGTDSECDETDEGNLLQNSLKVFNGSDLTVDEGVLRLMKLAMKRKLEKSLTEDILDLILAFLPKENNMPKTKYLLFKYVEDVCPLPPEKTHFYCSSCHIYLGEEAKNCTCGSSPHRFFQLSLKDQIKNLFENHNLADMIDDYAAERKKRQDEASEVTYFDVCDGKEYKRAHRGGTYDIVLLGHSDGLSLCKSSPATFFPLEFVICDIPIHVRFRFVLISGIWFDSVKPHMNCYLKPFAKELQELYDSGISWTHPKTKTDHISYVSAPGFCADAPVRADLQNILCHGGKHCCNICEQKMVKLPADEAVLGKKQKTRRRVFSFQGNPSKLRSALRMKVQGERTLSEEKKTGKRAQPSKGVKGRSTISKFPTCDRSTAVFPEYMHLLLGIIKCFISLWFNTSDKDKWSLKAHQKEIDLLLTNIRVPDFLTRIPRSLLRYAKWKANECRSFLLYFSLVVLFPFMKSEYFQHWILFVNSVYVLLQESVTETEIERVEIWLKMFLRDFSKLYRQEDFTYNFHCLSHLGVCVRRWGPPGSNSAFFFESYNGGGLAKCIHGSKNQAQELSNTLRLHNGVQVLNARITVRSGTSKNLGVVEFRNIIENFPLQSELRQALRTFGINEYVIVYHRAVMNGEIYTSKFYTRQKKRNNYTVCFLNSRGIRTYGEVNCFCKGTKNLAFITCFVVDQVKTNFYTETMAVVRHIIPVKTSIDVQLVSVESILSKVIRVGDFVCLRPNTYEVNL